MDSFEFNKLIGAFLGVVFVIFSVSLIGDAIFASPVPEKPGFAIEAAEPEAGHAGEAAPAAVPIATLLAKADPAAGETVFKKCATCHTADKGGPNKTGPNLWDVVNRPIASHEGFSYSAAMKNFAEGGKVVWDYEHLDHFIHSPKSYIKGTAMGFAGLKKDDERGNLIAYLRTLSDNPAPLPEPPAAAAGNAAAPAQASNGAAPAATGAAPAATGAAPATGSAPAPAGENKPAEPAPAPAN